MKPLLTAAVALAATAGYGLSRRHRTVSTAAPELRNPQLYVPLSLRNDTGLAVGRKLMAARPPGPIAEGVDVRHDVVPADEGRPEVPLVIYETADRVQPAPVLLWMHGGGLVMGTPETSQELCSRFAAELGVIVVGIDYRLAPEDRFPAALDDCAAALSWVHDRAADLGADPDRIAVGGDSAGGGLAACLAHRAHDDGGPAICFQLLQYPMLDDRTVSDDGGAALVWSAGSNRYAWSAYLGYPAGQQDPPPYAAAARREELGGLPSAWIGIGELDLFHDEAVDYAERLRAAGVHVDLHVEPGMYHAAEIFAPDAESMRAFRARMVAALGAAVASSANV